MTKESTIALEDIDANCNACKFMVRDLSRYNRSKTLHHLWQRQYFDLLNKKKIDKAVEWIKKDEWEKALFLIEEVNNSKFAFNNDAHISYGFCSKFNKDVSFIPNTLQLDTQECFENRRQSI